MRIRFRKLSKWQKPDCLFCKNNATQEGHRYGLLGVYIRCCDKSTCVAKTRKRINERWAAQQEALRQATIPVITEVEEREHALRERGCIFCRAPETGAFFHDGAYLRVCYNGACRAKADRLAGVLATLT